MDSLEGSANQVVRREIVEIERGQAEEKGSRFDLDLLFECLSED
jgi:hypothetical protein